MDPKNRFHTDSTWRWVRAEQLALLAGLSVLLLLHLRQVRPSRFIVAFVIIDLVGYVPGAIAYHRLGRGQGQARRIGGRIRPVYHHLYNLAHSYVIAGLWVGAWALLGGGLEWAMLAVPIHLSGDRGIFGNTYKPTELPFEPEAVAPERAMALAFHTREDPEC